MKRISLKVFTIVLAIVLVMPQQLLSASGLDYSIIDDSNDALGSENIVTRSQGENVYKPETSNLDYNYTIPDLELRKFINERYLKKTGDEIETYNATVAELNAFTSLDIVKPSGEMLVFESLEGIQHFTNATYFRLQNVIFPESGLEQVSELKSVDFMIINTVIFSGDDGYARRQNITVNGSEEHSEIYFPMDQYVDLSPLAKLTNLEQLNFSLNGKDQVGAYSYVNRTHYDISNLGTLVNMETLYLTDMASVDDSAFSCLENMTNLKQLFLLDTPLNDVYFVEALPNLTRINIYGTYITDFTPLIDKSYFTGASGLRIEHPVSYYESKDVDGTAANVLSIDTEINLGTGIDSIEFTTRSSHLDTFEVLNYNYNDTLKVDFNVKELKEYKMFNWATGQSDREKLGYIWGTNITTDNGKTISYSTNAMSVGKVVTFDANHEGGPRFDVQVQPFDLIEEPKIKDGNLELPRTRATVDFGRVGYEMVGWSTDPQGTEMFDFNSVQNMNITLYAQWQKETTDQVDPVKPTEPVDPVEPTDPIDPDPTDPADPMRVSSLSETGIQSIAGSLIILLGFMIVLKYFAKRSKLIM